MGVQPAGEGVDLYFPVAVADLHADGDGEQVPVGSAQVVFLRGGAGAGRVVGPGAAEGFQAGRYRLFPRCGGGGGGQHVPGCLVVPGCAVGEYRDLAAVEEPLPDAVVLFGVAERFGPAACPGEGPGAVGEQD